MNFRNTQLLVLAVLLFTSCKEEVATLFTEMSAEDTGLVFENTLVETEDYNVMTYEYIYNGGGVAVGDLNNDGLADVYLSGNQVNNKLFLNKGDFKFEDITAKAKMSTVMDCWIFIYVTRAMLLQKGLHNPWLKNMRVEQISYLSIRVMILTAYPYS